MSSTQTLLPVAAAAPQEPACGPISEPSIAAVLPCNVVVRSLDAGTTVVEAFDPAVMMGMSEAPALGRVAADARQRITAALAALTQED